MFNYKDLVIKSKQLKDANLNEKDLDIVKYAVTANLIADLHDKREKGCEGVVNGIFHALKSQGRDDLNNLVSWELHEHSCFEVW